MSRNRTWGVLASVVTLGCGGNTRHGQPLQQPTPSDAGGMLNGAGSGGATSKPMKPLPLGGAAGSATTSWGGAETSGGDSTSQGGAEPINPCAGIVPRCLAGEPVCDPVRGKLTTCSDCGEPLPGGEAACTRILASDKESNGVCVVRSSDQLGCWTGWGQGQTNVLPADVVELVLGDDFASAQNPLSPCVRKSSGEYSCLSGAKDSLRLAVGDSGLCAIFSNHELYCEGSVNKPAVLVPSPVDMTITDGSAFVLGAIGVVAIDLPARLPTFWKGTPAKLLVDHQSAGCIVSDLGELACWTDLTEALRPSPWDGKYRKLVLATMPRACVLDDERQVRCGDIFADAEPAPLGTNDAVDVTASASTVCALSVAGRVSCWNGAGEPLEVPEGW
ncbi:MAG TPA: hypothetical protein VHB79_04000 [Polyangiaceae bacterium]|nr:hypothetical protein [Polyangiaceae bacterium]